MLIKLIQKATTLFTISCILLLSACSDASIACQVNKGVVLQILGSGGPIADDGRASSAYLVWVNGKAKVMIDAGSGSILRFAESAAEFTDVDFVGLSHFHTDHSADFPALLKSASFAQSKRNLVVAGPVGSTIFPGLHAYLDSMLAKGRGAYGYLSGYLDGSGGLPKIRAIEVDAESPDAATVFTSSDKQIIVQAMHVPHGIVPALAFRVSVGDLSVVFASDQNGNDPRFTSFAKNADILVMHMPVPLGASGVARKLHATPDVIGQIAADSNAGTLVVSHFMARSLRAMDENLAAIRGRYNRDVVTANDLQCVSL